jgi:hypothetical protein
MIQFALPWLRDVTRRYFTLKESVIILCVLSIIAFNALVTSKIDLHAPADIVGLADVILDGNSTPVMLLRLIIGAGLTIYVATVVITLCTYVYNFDDDAKLKQRDGARYRLLSSCGLISLVVGLMWIGYNLLTDNFFFFAVRNQAQLIQRIDFGLAILSAFGAHLNSPRSRMPKRSRRPTMDG